MKIQQRFSQEADAAAARYGLLIDALRSLYLSAFQDRSFGAPALLKRLAAEADALIAAYLRTEERLADSALHAIAQNALGATRRELMISFPKNETDAIGELTSATLDYLRVELALQAQRDKNTLIEAVRHAALQISLSARAVGQSREMAIRQYQFSANLEFYFRDRRNHRLLARKFVRALWRQALLSLYNEVVLVTLAEHGESTAQVEHLDAKAPIDGMIIAMSASAAHPIYDEVRSQIFHPNSDAVLKRTESA